MNLFQHTKAEREPMLKLVKDVNAMFDKPRADSTLRESLFERPIRHHTAPGDVLYDPFVGSGTAIIAAEKTGRAACAIDLDPRYVQATIDRWQAFTGGTAVPIG